MPYKIIRTLPYIILSLLALIFTVFSMHVSDELWKIIFVNLASSSIFVIVAYPFYDSIKSYIDRHESEYIDSYIRNQISHDVFAVLYML
jgi:ABC-type maltose transport system permease subunit